MPKKIVRANFELLYIERKNFTKCSFPVPKQMVDCPDQPTVPGCNTNSYSTCFTKDYYSNTIM